MQAVNMENMRSDKMLRIYVDSGSSIKPFECEKYNIKKVFPLQITFSDKTYFDGLDINNEIFYDYLVNKKEFPKTSLPIASEINETIRQDLKNGDKVLYLAMSSGLSGTYNMARMLFEDEKDVLVVDTKTAVGGVRLILKYVNEHLDDTLEDLEKGINDVISKIKVIAVPENLQYLFRGGRLSKHQMLIGNILRIKPIMKLDENGKVEVIAKEIGLKKTQKKLVSYLDEFNCDTTYPIVGMFSYNKQNLDDLKKIMPQKYQDAMIEYDDVSYVIASHWGPGSFGFVFLSK
jgi:DegV family protein with EDD domain